jgi:hypothetical protein
MTLTAAFVQSKFGGSLDLVCLNNNEFVTMFFRSSDDSTSGERPKLVVNYTEADGVSVPSGIIVLAGVSPSLNSTINMPDEP